MPADCHVARGEGKGGGKGPGSGTGEEFRVLEAAVLARGAFGGAGGGAEKMWGLQTGTRGVAAFERRRSARRTRPLLTPNARHSVVGIAPLSAPASSPAHRSIDGAIARPERAAEKWWRGAGGEENKPPGGARSVMAHAGVPHVIISRCAADLRITRSRPLGRPPARPPPRLVTRARPGDRPTSTPRPWPPSPAPPSPRRCRAAASPSRCARAPPATPRATPEDGRIRLPSPPRGGGRDPPRHASRRARARRPATGAPNDLAAVPPRRSPSPR